MSDFLDKDLFAEIAKRTLDVAKKHGAVQAEVSLSRALGTNVTTRLGALETLEHLQNQAVSITVYKDQRKASVSSSDLSEAALERSVNQAIDFAHYTEEDADFGLADKLHLAFDYPAIGLYFPHPLSTEKYIEMAIACETAGLDVNGITNSDGASVFSSLDLMAYANSHGFYGAYQSSNYMISAAYIAGEGAAMQQNYDYTSAREFSSLVKATDIGTQAAERTLAKVNPRTLKTGTYPVIFDASVATSLFSAFLRAVNGAALYRGMSFLPDSLGTTVFPEHISLNERPHLKAAPASAPFDGEGVRTENRALVTDGVVNGYVLNSYYARKLKLETTGNSGGTHNIQVSTGKLDREALLKEMGTGLLVTELMGQGVNMITGDYSKAAFGFWIEHGDIAYPVHNITIAGNLRDIYKGMVAVGTDIDKRRSIQTGSVWINQMMVSGT
jgi:PmbA protein